MSKPATVPEPLPAPLSPAVRKPLRLLLKSTEGGKLGEVLTRVAKETYAAVAGVNPSGLETLLSERVALCRVSLFMAENTRNLVLKREGANEATARYYNDLLDREHRRYLAAIKALAQVRRLQLPAVTVAASGQVNIGTQQLNVTGEAAAPSMLTPPEGPCLPHNRPKRQG